MVARTRVILDTNALLLFGTEGLDVFTAIEEAVESPIQIVIPEAVMAELRKRVTGSSKKAVGAKLALAIVNERLGKGAVARFLFPQKGIPLKIIPSSASHADDAILAIAEGDDIVCTLDRELRRRLKVRVLGKQGKGFREVQ